MAIVICDISALEIYRANRFGSFSPSLRARAAERIFSGAEGSLTSAEVQSFDISRYGVSSSAEPLHLLVASDKLKHRVRGAISHVRVGTVTSSMFVELEPNVYMVSPEMLFLQMAVSLELPILAELGMELCGSYEVGPYVHRNDVRPRPLTTPLRLRRFLEMHDGEYGTRKALAAISHVVENSWSPMETKLCLLLCLPRTMGGYSLPKPLMNEEIKLPPHIVLADGRRSLFCDLYWKDRFFVVEYDGREDHSNRAGVVRDNRKKAVLTSLGIDSISLTSLDVFYADAMDLAAERIACGLGVKQRPPARSMLKKRIELRKTLLFG